MYLGLAISICLTGHGEVHALCLPHRGIGPPRCAGSVGRFEVQQEHPSPHGKHRWRRTGTAPCRSPEKLPGQHLAERRLFSLVASGKSMPLSLSVELSCTGTGIGGTSARWSPASFPQLLLSSWCVDAVKIKAMKHGRRPGNRCVHR